MSFDEKLYENKNPEYYFQGREEMLPFIKPEVKFVLDVGCSSGGFGKLLKEKRNCVVWGVEPTDAANEASTHLDKVYHDFFHPALDFENSKFDAVIFNDVLEHLANPWEALTFSTSILKEKGYIVASIPNIQCYEVLKGLVTRGEWTYTSSGILDKTHLRFFTKKTIQQMFTDTGYEVIDIEGQNSVVQNSRLLRLLNVIFPRRIAPFLYVNYAVCARKK